MFVFFQRMEEMESYYPNYYANRKSQKRHLINNHTHHRHNLHNDKNHNNKLTIKKKKKHIDDENQALNTIKLEAKWSKQVIHYSKDTQMIYASISRNLQPILNASVRALIHRPTGDYISLELYDNGLNADRYANDGVYTRYFSNFNSNGVYFARVIIYTNFNLI